ncbi:MAG: RNA chaperone Hfq [Clostridiales bacterium]|nr:RNA chaperone Hfq [Clostridiales bacterium]
MLKTSPIKKEHYPKSLSRIDNMRDELCLVSGTKTPIHVHEIFLNCCRKDCENVEVVTKSGEVINGFIDGYDKETIVLHNEMTQLLIYKHAIDYITPVNGKSLIIPEKEMRTMDEENKYYTKNKKD